MLLLQLLSCLLSGAALVSGQTSPTPTTTTTPTPTPTSSPVFQLTPQSYDGSASITITSPYAIRSCGPNSPFECSACPAQTITIPLKLDTLTTCTTIANWWTPQYGFYNLTAIGYTYEPNSKYTSFNNQGYYGGRFRVYKIPYQPDIQTFHQPIWNPSTVTKSDLTTPFNIPLPTDCNQAALIRQYDITPLSKCSNISQWSLFNTSSLLNGAVPLPYTPINPIPMSPPIQESQVANQWPDTMTWFYDPTTIPNTNQMYGNEVAVGAYNSVKNNNVPGDFCTSQVNFGLTRQNHSYDSDYSGSISINTCFISDCVPNATISTNFNTNNPTVKSALDYGFQATFDITGFPSTCPPPPTTMVPTATPAPTTSAPTTVPVTLPCNDTHAMLVQQCAFNTTGLFPSGNLSFIAPLFTPYLSPLSTLSSTTNATSNYTISSAYCNFNSTWNSCINNQTIPSACKQAMINQTALVIGNTSLPNCSSLTPPTTITIPTCGNGTRLNTSSNTCYNLTCTVTWANVTIGNVTQVLGKYDSEILANGTSCGVLYPTQSYSGCTLQAVLINNTYTYTWNSSMMCNTAYLSWNTTTINILNNTSCMNGTWYNTNITTQISYMNTTYPNGTIISTNTTFILSNITYNTNITCISGTTVVPTSIPTTSSSDVTFPPPTDQPTTTSQDKAAGTAMALILGFSALGVGILYWVWFRARRNKPNWQQAQQQIQSSQSQQLEEEEEEEEEQQI